MESLFLVVPVATSSTVVQDDVRQCLSSHNACIEAEGVVSSNQVLHSHSMQSALFSGAQHWAVSPSSQVLEHPFASSACGVEEATPCPAEEDAKSLFYAHYGELWDAVFAERRLRTAHDFIAEEGVSATELASCCAAATAADTLTLPTHLSLVRIAQNAGKAVAQYVANASFPALYAQLFDSAGEERAFWWCSAAVPASASPPAASQPGQEVGDPDDGVEGLLALAASLRSVLSASAGSRVVVNPLEALAYRAAWMHAPLLSDAFAAAMLRRGVPLGCVAALLRDPALHDHGRFTSVYEAVQDLSAAEAADTVAELWARLLPGLRQPTHKPLDGAPALYDCATGYVDLATAAAVAPPAAARTHAVALLHPRLSADDVDCDALRDALMRQGVAVDAVQRSTAEELQGKLDLHHDRVARYALDQEALQRFSVDGGACAAAALSRFEEHCGVAWSVALAEGRLWSVELAQQLLGYDYAQRLMKDCLNRSDTTTHQLTDFVSVTTVTREDVVRQTYPTTSVAAVLPSTAPSQPSGPYSLTLDSFFIVNAAYGVYRHDVLMCAAKEDLQSQVWQLSWPAAQEIDLEHLQRHSPSAPDDEEQTQHGEERRTVLSAYQTAVGPCVSALYPLLGVCSDPAAALRARHLWWGVSYDDDDVSQQLRARGESWLTLLPPLTATSADADAEAVLILPPTVTADHVLQLMKAALHEHGVTVVDEADVFGAAAADYAFGGHTLLATASAFAHRRGALLWESVPPALRLALSDAAEDIRDAADIFVPPLSADTIVGGAAAIAALQLTASEFAAAWEAAAPRRVHATCWLAFFVDHDVWVLDGHVPLLEQQYSAEAARVHLLRLRWPQATASWDAMQRLLVGGGEEEGGSGGLLSTLLSGSGAPHEAAAAETALAAAQPLYLLSSTPYDALIDVLRWPRDGRSSPLRCDVALEDWLLQQPYVRHQLRASVACPLSSVVQQVRESLAGQPPRYRWRADRAAAPQWISRVATAHRSEQRHHGFLWLHPSSVTPALLAALPGLLLQHRVHVSATGSVALSQATQRQLLDVQHDGFYKNAYERTAAEVPVTDAEALAFAAAFGQDWVTAVQLGLVLNTREAEQRYGAVPLTAWWNSAAEVHKAQLSAQLLVGYMEEEGVYVMNAPYSYRRARLYAGGATVTWYAVEWLVEEMTWEAFMAKVVGDANPAHAAPGSLRHHFAANWTQYSLPGKPDEVECVLHASDSPLAALAERTRWLSCPVEQDPYGSVLLQSGVHPALLARLLTNPSVYRGDTGLITEAFRLLPQQHVHQLVRQLRAYTCLSGVLVIQDGTQLIPPPRLPDTPTHDGEQTAGGPASPSWAEQLLAYRNVALQHAVNPFQLPSPHARAFAAADASSVGEGSDAVCRAVLYLDPAAHASFDGLPHCSSAVCSFVEQHLRHRGIAVVHKRTVQCASAAEAVVLFRSHHTRLYRYGIDITAAETLASSAIFQARFAQHFGVSSHGTGVVVRNAAEMTEVLHASGRDVATLWERARRQYPHDALTLAADCVVQRLQPRKPFFLLNGHAVAAEETFAAAQAAAGVRVWYLQWDSAATTPPAWSYAQLARLVEQLGSSTGALQQCWAAYGGAVPPSTPSPAAGGSECPQLHLSDGTLAAVRHRQLWLGLPLSSDPTVRRWLQPVEGGGAANTHDLPPRALRWALGDPLVSATDGGDATCLSDALRGLSAQRTGEMLRQQWAAHRGAGDPGEAELPRNTAVLALMPQVAANAAVRQLVRSVLAENGLRIDGCGFVARHTRSPSSGGGSGSSAGPPSSVPWLLPEDWRCAMQDPGLLTLTPQEADRVAEVFGCSWASMVERNQILPARRATKRLGGMSTRQLQLFVKGAKKALWVRPCLHLAELAEYGVCVLNAHVAHLTHAIAAAADDHPLPFYTVSWSPSRLSWAECAARVAGAAELASGGPASHTIRARISAGWAALGLRAAPGTGDSVVCMSDGPVHALLARLHLGWPAMEALEEDVFGAVALERAGEGVVPLLRGWLSNAVVTCDGRADSVLGHLANWETDETCQLLSRMGEPGTPRSLALLPADLAAVRQEGHEAEGKRAAEAAWEAAVRQRDELPALLSLGKPAPSESLPAATGTPTKEAEEKDVLYRNSGTLLFLRSQLNGTQRRALRDHLRQHGIAVHVVAAEEEQEATPELLDRLRPTECYYAACPDLASRLAESGEVAEEDQQRFNVVFRDGAGWDQVLRNAQEAASEAPGLYSAAEAMRRWGMTPQQLGQHIRDGTTMQLSEGIEVTRLRGAAGSTDSVDSTRADAAGTDSEPAAPQRQSCLSTDLAGPAWSGHFVVNGAYAALRDALGSRRPPTTTTPSPDSGAAPPAETLSLWEVSWDSRVLPWRRFVQRVMGCPDGARAAPGSFNALLHASLRPASRVGEEGGEEGACAAATPLPVMGVVPASGPLAALAMRSRWCRNAQNRVNTYLPDPLVRAMAVAGTVVPQEVLDAWLLNPVARVSGAPALTTRRVQRRLFDWTRGCDTPQVVEAVGELDWTANAAADADTEEEEKAVGVTPSPPPPPPRMKAHLHAARMKDAILHARTDADCRRLWDYYRSIDVPAADAVPTLTREAAETIPFTTFYSDFKLLDTFGVPNMSHELKLLFVDVEVDGRGRMTYWQFRHALSLYHTM